MSTRAPASQSSAATSPPVGGVYRHLACVRCLTRSSLPGETPWLTACYQLVPHLQRLRHDLALLDLGPCSDEEAIDSVQALIARLRLRQITLRAAIGPSGILAQLALLRAPAHEPLALVTPAQSTALLQWFPVRALSHLRLAVPLAITPELVATLEGYGVRTLAQLARLAEEQLRRQFGARLGTILAAMARGEDPLPLQPAPAPRRLHFRLRLISPIASDRLLLGLAPFAAEVAA